MSPIRDQQIGIFEIASYLAAAVAVVGTLVWGWDLNLIILLFILVVAYAVLRDLRTLCLLKWRNEPSSPSEQTILFQRSSSHSQARRPRQYPVVVKVVKTESITGFGRSILTAQEKGTVHEVERISKA